MKRVPPAAGAFLLSLAVITPYLLSTPAPSPRVELARRLTENFPDLGWQRAWGGGSPLWMAGPPALPALMALVSSAGISPEKAEAGIAGGAYAAGAAGVYYLARSLGLAPGWTAAAFALAPYRWSDLAREGNSAHAAALALLPWVCLLRRRLLAAAAGLALAALLDPAAALAGAAGLILIAARESSNQWRSAGPGLALSGWFWTSTPRASFLPEIEFGLLLAVSWWAARRSRPVLVVALGCLFCAALSWKMLFAEPLDPPALQPQARIWLGEHAPSEPVLGLAAPSPALNPVRRQAEDLILGPDHPDLSVLWLQALGVSHLVSGRGRKYAASLEAEALGVYSVPLRRPAPAVLVSRRGWKALPAIRSLLDRQSLAAYLEWANRPEAAGFRWTSASTAEASATLGPDEMILVRQNFVPGWTATLAGRPIPLLCDPLGFLLLDPASSGPARIELAHRGSGWRARWPSTRPLPARAVPAINPGGIVDGLRNTSPPLAPGAVISIYGRDLEGDGATRVLVNGRPAQVLYASARQVNAQLPEETVPGPAEVVVEAGGIRSDPVSVSIAKEAATLPSSSTAPARPATRAAAPGAPRPIDPRRFGFYQWAGVGARDDPADLLTQARRRATAAGARVFRFYLGARFDYLQHPGSPRLFAADTLAAPSPAAILGLPRYRAALEDPELDTIILTTYTTEDSGAGADDLSLLRPWTAAAEEIESRQIGALCSFLYQRFAYLNKTIVIANSEADDKMLEILNYTGSIEQAVENLVAWTRCRHRAIEQARAARPASRLRILHGFEVSLVNLKIGRAGTTFRKSPSGAWNALAEVIPRVPFDLLLYSAYESTNSPFETQDTNTDPAGAGERLLRDLDRLRERARPSLSPAGRRLFGQRFVAIGELGFARERFEHLDSGGVLPRLSAALDAAQAWGCPYIVLWQIFDSPRAGGEAWGFGLVDSGGRAPRLRPGPEGCPSVEDCLRRWLRPN